VTPVPAAFSPAPRHELNAEHRAREILAWHFMLGAQRIDRRAKLGLKIAAAARPTPIRILRLAGDENAITRPSGFVESYDSESGLSMVRHRLYESAADYAKDRASEVMRQVGRVTREKVDQLFGIGLEEGWSNVTYAKELESARVFSKSRAQDIGKFEYLRARNSGAAATMEFSGVTHVFITDGEDFDEECASVHATVQTIAWYLANPLGHPNCTRDAMPWNGPAFLAPRGFPSHWRSPRSAVAVSWTPRPGVLHFPVRADALWDEEKHPRDAHGRFGSGGDGGNRHASLPGLGLSRAEMPQIKSGDMDEFLQYARDHGVDVDRTTMRVGDLAPTQNEYNPEHAAQLTDAALRKPLVVSQDGHVLDGHNRWARLHEIDPDAKIDVNRVNLPTMSALGLMHSFPKSFTKDISSIGRSGLAARMVLAWERHQSQRADAQWDEEKHPRDEHGRFGSGGGAPARKKDSDHLGGKPLDPRAHEHAKRIYDRATQTRSDVRPVLDRAVQESGGRLSRLVDPRTGLSTEQKTLDSIQRKIGDKVALDGKTYEQASSEIFDSARWTIVGSADKQDAIASSVIAGMKADGWEKFDNKFKNYWVEGNSYKGLNMNFTRDGAVCEIQIHTPESLRSAETNHAAYDVERRLAADDIRRFELQRQMRERARRLRHPDLSTSSKLFVYVDENNR
jgi:hypothetical protein